VYGPEGVGGDSSLLFSCPRCVSDMLQYMGRDDRTASRDGTSVFARAHLEDKAVENNWLR
jgi:hypothetical protein